VGKTMKAKFITPAVTAFRRDGSLDRESNQALWEYLIARGMDGVAVMGSTGEFFAMPPDQRRELAKLAVDAVRGRTKVIVGTCSMNLRETIELTNHAHDAGADAVILISPYYFKLSDESIESYYDAVASGTNANILLYNFPDRTGYDLSPAVTLNLLRKHRNIAGYKDTVGGIGHTRALIEAVKPEFPEFEIYSGFEENFAANVLSGGAGCVGGLSNFAAGIFAAWRDAVNAKDFDGISQGQQAVNALSALYGIGTPFVPVVKKAMVLKGIIREDWCTPPILTANAAQTEAIKALLQQLRLL
jgi:4-hydroxy-tetrahydrodipicolinate synthase